MEALDLALDAAQTELAAAEIGLAEATARAATARDGQARLKAAVAALSGEPPAAAMGTIEIGGDGVARTLPVDTSIVPETATQPGRQAAAEMSPEEFDALRKKKQRAKEKELIAQNPYGTVKCTGCGVAGKLQETLIQAPSGVPVKMLICGGCGNQVMI